MAPSNHQTQILILNGWQRPRIGGAGAGRFTPGLEAFAGRYLEGEEVDTDIVRSRFAMDEARWLAWETLTLQRWGLR